MDTQKREALYNELQCTLGKKPLTLNAPMNRYTTLRLGGPAEMLYEADSSDGLAQALAIARRHEATVTILGNGSNVLVKDGGIRGLVIRVGDGMSHVFPPEPLPDGRFALMAEAGATLTKLSNAAASHGLAGLEFASGIPGTVGGAVYMNAGAYGGEMKDYVTSATGLDMAGRPLRWTNEEMAFGYRQSRFSRVDGQAALTSVTVALKTGDAETIRVAMQEFTTRRREKQPIALPSCGSTFKRPEGQFAGTLIEQCGLKGARIGGASVSELHAGFLVNDQGGTAADFLALIAHIQRVVLEKTGVKLEPEVRIVGEDSPAVSV